MNKFFLCCMTCLLLFFSEGCDALTQQKISIILDTDANNELDDQHALAYLFFNTNTFDVKGITVNGTHGGSNVQKHYNEAKRVMQLCNVWGKYPLVLGADKSFSEIIITPKENTFDGKEAVDFIIKEALKVEEKKLVIAAIGKLTNVALALQKAPEIEDKITVVWLGSNYPASGEYNLESDVDAVNYVLNQNVDFEMVVVRYYKNSGTDAVRVTPKEIEEKLAGKGVKVAPVEGRHGGTFTTFGDYAVNLFSKIYLPKKRPSRALYDLVALSILKNPKWGKKRSISAPHLVDKKWQNRPSNTREIVLWEYFNKDAILTDFYKSFEFVP